MKLKYIILLCAAVFLGSWTLGYTGTITVEDLLDSNQPSRLIINRVIGTDGSTGPALSTSIAGTESGGTLQELRVDSNGNLGVYNAGSASYPTAVTVNSPGTYLKTLSTVSGRITGTSATIPLLTDGSGNLGVYLNASNLTYPVAATVTSPGTYLKALSTISGRITGTSTTIPILTDSSGNVGIFNAGGASYPSTVTGPGQQYLKVLSNVSGRITGTTTTIPLLTDANGNVGVYLNAANTTYPVAVTVTSPGTYLKTLSRISGYDGAANVPISVDSSGHLQVDALSAVISSGTVSANSTIVANSLRTYPHSTTACGTTHETILQSSGMLVAGVNIWHIVNSTTAEGIELLDNTTPMWKASLLTTEGAYGIMFPNPISFSTSVNAAFDIDTGEACVRVYYVQ